MRTSARIGLAIGLAGLWLSCGDSPATPTRPAEFSASLTGVTISGPSQIAPAERCQFTATARYVDGSTKDVTSTANWRLNGDAVRSIGGGSFAGRVPGESDISATWNGRESSTATLLVLEPGTYRLSGTVTDAHGTLEGALLDVLSGKGAGLHTTSRYNGRYAFYGVAGDVEIRASAGGYSPQLLQAVVNDQTVRDVRLVTTIAPEDDLTGEWMLTLAASPTCSANWPQQARQRQFSASLVHQGPKVWVLLSSPTLASADQDLRGTVTDRSFTLPLLVDTYYSYYYVLDRPSPTEWLGISGTIRGTAGASSIVGTFDGAFYYYVTPANATYPRGNPAVCDSDKSLVLRRQ